MTDSAVEIAGLTSRANALVPFLRERAEEIDQLGHLPDEVVGALHDIGAYRLTEPAHFGGGGLAPAPLSVLCDVIMEVAKGNGSAGWSVMINLGPLGISAYGDDIAREVLTTPHVGPRLAGTIFQMRAKAEGRRTDGGYLIKGTWGFPSNVWHCAWLYGGFSHTDDDGNRQFAMALLPRTDFEIADDWNVEGLKGSGSHSAYTTTEVFVPDERVVSMGQFLAVDPFVLVAGYLGISALVIGCAHGALECFIEGATRRPGFGGAPTIASMPTTQHTIAKVRAQIDLAELALRNATRTHDHAIATGTPIPPEHAALIAYENVHVAHQVRHAIEELTVTIGSSAAAEADPMTRFIRDLRVACLHGLLRPEPQAEKYGRVLLGIEENTGPSFSHWRNR